MPTPDYVTSTYIGETYPHEQRSKYEEYRMIIIGENLQYNQDQNSYTKKFNSIRS